MLKSLLRSVHPHVIEARRNTNFSFFSAVAANSTTCSLLATTLPSTPHSDYTTMAKSKSTGKGIAPATPLAREYLTLACNRSTYLWDLQDTDWTRSTNAVLITWDNADRGTLLDGCIDSVETSSTVSTLSSFGTDLSMDSYSGKTPFSFAGQNRPQDQERRRGWKQVSLHSRIT